MPPTRQFAETLLTRLEGLLIEAETSNKPLEVDPYRGQLFDLFAMAEAAGGLEEDVEPDLSADGVCAALAQRWGLKAAAEESFQKQDRMSPEHVGRMRLLWSVLRMWMEWTYAWQRWVE
ncbi:MAG: hypothetical protein KDA58_16815, partial [Planctomycetaceae bacterium]|nr:hypothetical protein [Planctomycetaceae bacterium]